jgi:hypothetical protein
MTNEYNVLFVQIYSGKGIASEFLFRNPSEYRNLLIETQIPDIKKWATKEIFDPISRWPNNINLKFELKEKNISGHFIAANINTRSKVIDDPVNPETLISELVKDSYTHVAFSILSNDYTNFIKCAQMVKQYDSSIITLAGSTGAMFPQTCDYVDHVCIGECGVFFMRRLLGEEIERPYNLTLIECTNQWKYNKIELNYTIYRIITKVGCPMECDFCTTPKLYNNYYSGELFTPKVVYNYIIQHLNKLKLDKIALYFEEPTSMYSLKWWYELFDLFKDDFRDISFIVYSLSTILNKLDLDRISNSAARIQLVNFGIESFNKQYLKNIKVDLKALVSRLTDYGITTNPNYIIGYDFDTKESVWKDVDKLIELGATINTVLHLHPHPLTEVWNFLLEQDRLLDLSPEYYFLHGFQSFRHPHFKPGFEDILPLLCEIYNYIERETGGKLVNVIQVYRNLRKHMKNPKLLQKELSGYQSVAKMLFPHWKAFFNTTEEQNARYLNKSNLKR